METFKFFIRLLFKYFLIIISLFLTTIVIFIIGMSFIIFNNKSNKIDPKNLSNKIIIENQVNLSENTKKILNDNKIWLMILDDKGKIVNDFKLPKELKKTYSQNDIIKFTRWYLKDYPVFTFVVNENESLVLGYPKASFEKFPANYYRFDNLIFIMDLFISIIIVLIILVFYLYFKARTQIEKEIKPITNSIEALSQNQEIELDESGNLSEIKEAINNTSRLLRESKKMRTNWIRDVSHDLRNPLTLINSYTLEIDNKFGASEDTKKISNQIQIMENFISNLNLSYILDDKSINQEMTKLNINSILRNIVADFLNSYSDINLNFNISYENYFIWGNKTLIERSIRNLIYNSFIHNEKANIQLSLLTNKDNLEIIIEDNGSISISKVKELNIKDTNYKIHGMGTIISKQIIKIHKGDIKFIYNNPGLIAKISLPLLNE